MKNVYFYDHVKQVLGSTVALETILVRCSIQRKYSGVMKKGSKDSRKTIKETVAYED